MNANIMRVSYRRARQRGAVLFIALIVLVAMTLAGIGLLRSVDTGSLIAGNLAFRSMTTSAADAGIETARNYLMGQTPTFLNNDGAGGTGYVANWQTGFNPWTNTNWNTVGNDPLGNTVQYIIHRMCASSGLSVDATPCVKVSTSSSGSTKSGSGTAPLAGVTLVYYRITAKVTGPKNTVSLVQAFTY